MSVDLDYYFDEAGHGGPTQSLDLDYIVRRGRRARARRHALLGATAILGAGVIALAGGAFFREATQSDSLPSATTSSGIPVPISTSSWKPGDPAALALAQGVLMATPDHCLFLQNTHGELVASGIIWPAGYTARAVDGTVEVARPDGVVVARTGKPLALGGGFGDATASACSGIGTGSNQVFWVNDNLPPIG